METYKKLKKSTKIGLIVSAVLLLAVLINNAFILVKAFQFGFTPPAVLAIVDTVMCAIILLYAFFGYKKPHGNMLKYAFFVFAGYVALQGTVVLAAESALVLGGLTVLSGLIIAYVAGRLHKIEKNTFLLLFAGLLLLAREIVGFATSFVVPDVSVIIGTVTPIVTFAALSFAYVARYEEHKAAGLADKADA